MSKYSKENGFTPFAHVGCQILSKSKRIGLHPFSNGNVNKNGFTLFANGGCQSLLQSTKKWIYNLS